MRVFAPRCVDFLTKAERSKQIITSVIPVSLSCLYVHTEGILNFDPIEDGRRRTSGLLEAKGIVYTRNTNIFSSVLRLYPGLVA